MGIRIVRKKSAIFGLALVVILATVMLAVYFTSYHVFIPYARVRIVDPIFDAQSRNNATDATVNEAMAINKSDYIANNEVYAPQVSPGRKVLTYKEGKYVRRPFSTTKATGSNTPYKEKVYANDKYHGRCYNFPPTPRVTHPLTAAEIAKVLSEQFEISERTERDIAEAVDMNLVSINRSDVNNIKIILGFHGYEHTPHYTWYNFSHCEYTNCIPFNPHRSLEHPMAPDSVTAAASIILFNLVEMYHGDTLRKIPRRHDQYFGVTSLESTGYSFNLMPSQLDGQINFTATYHRKSTVPEWHIFKACIDRRVRKLPSVNYAQGKTKGALAYVSNCNSVQYNRLNMIHALGKHIPVDIYGACGSPDPCANVENRSACSHELHKHYHFYLSFENSLCEDYISEKYWDRLSDTSYMLPVAMGGLTVQEYTEQSPENSFLHVRNFTTIDEVGSYLRRLMEDNEAYNAYHKWRESWDVYRRPIYTRFPSCDLCRIANEKPLMPADPKLSTRYNDPAHCKVYEQF